MIEIPDRPAVDTTRMAACGDYLAVVVVHADGTESLWLLSEDEQNHGCACPGCAPHDQLGAWIDGRRDAAR